MLKPVNLNTVIGGSVETARRWLAEGDNPADIYQSLAPAILAVNAKQQMPLVSPTTPLENLLRTEAGWDPSALNPSATAADWGPC